jgi:hypothetical protein
MPEGAKAGSAPPFRAAAKWARPALVSTFEGRYNCESSCMCLRESPCDGNLSRVSGKPAPGVNPSEPVRNFPLDAF